ncbi:MAG: radical SAM protein [Nitrospirota bacterium]
MPTGNEHDFIVQWHLTERCNLSCRHCYQTGGRSDELSLHEITDVVSEAAEMFGDWAEAYGIGIAPSFTLTGGEPFLRPDLAQVLETIADRGFELFLLSNGTMIDMERARMLAALGVKGVQVSIEGPEAVHERIRGKGSFAAALRGVHYLLGEGIEVTLNTTLSEVNADSFMRLVSLASAMGVHRLGFSRLVPSGRGAGLLSDMLDTGRVKRLYTALRSLGTDNLALVSGDPLFSQMAFDAETGEGGSVACGGCAAALSGLTILPDGTVTPCRRLPIPIGNVREDSLRELWAVSPVLEQLRNRRKYKGKCGRCSRWAVCRGCRAIAYAAAQARGSDDFLGEDPQCFLHF